MTVQMFLVMLFVFASISSLVTEAIKGIINNKMNYSSNIIVLIVSIIIGAVGMGIYYVLFDIAIGDKEIVYMVLMSLAIWLVSTHGYDKVRQTIIQIKEMQG